MCLLIGSYSKNVCEAVVAEPEPIDRYTHFSNQYAIQDRVRWLIHAVSDEEYSSLDIKPLEVHAV